MAETKQLHAVISGRVQGVGFRFFVARRARQLGLVGWVRNRVDGAVEVKAEGAEPTLAQLLDELKHGPPGAWVRDVKARWHEPENTYREFLVVPTSHL